jgi:hypothetical protein
MITRGIFTYDIPRPFEEVQLQHGLRFSNAYNQLLYDWALSCHIPGRFGKGSFHQNYNPLTAY